MRKQSCLLIYFLLITACLSAQQITGTITDQEKNGVGGVTISIRNASDSAVIKWTLTDKQGKFNFSHILPGRYFTSTSHVGYKDNYSVTFDFPGTAEYVIPSQEIVPAPRDLKAVVVTSQRPVVEVKADKTILNVEGTINATGSDALELLRKSPGVLVDKDDNLSLSGKNGVQVYIDGRPSPLAGKDLSDYLKSIQSSQIESIEIISNPSAKYEAAGNAGIINIKLKKNKALGTNGSFNAGYNIGSTSKYNGGLTLNHRNKKINLFGNYNLNIPNGEAFINIRRIVLDTLFDQRSRILFKPTSQNFKGGMDYFISKKSTVGIMVNGVLIDGDLGSHSSTPISFQPESKVHRILSAATETKFKRDNLNANLNYRYADTSGRELNIDGDYGFYKIRTNQFQPNYYFDPTGMNELSRAIYNMIAPNDLAIYSVKADYEQNYKKGKLGMGGKISYVNSKNDFQRYNVFDSGKILDTLKSNNFNYRENINALYINYNRTLKTVLIQFGLRMENTHSEGRSTGFKKGSNPGYTIYDSTFERSYTGLFPSAAITFTKDPKNQWTISYSRRIDRPTYQSLNPFEFKLDEYTSQKGNTQLRPQYTQSISISNIYQFKLSTKLGYSHVKDMFAQVFDTAEGSKAFQIPRNLATQDIISLDISYPLQVKWYSAFFNLNTYYSHYKANLGAGRVIDLAAFVARFFMQHSFDLGKQWNAECSGFFNSPSVSAAQGTFRSAALWSVDIGLQKKVLHGNGNLKISLSDIFNTLRPVATSNFAGQFAEFRSGFESRQFKINFNYRFGSAQIKAARQRKTGLEEESRRVQSQGGGN